MNESIPAEMDLFSVDADAHLQKLAASMFPTPAQLPAELVREALRRGAGRVAVEARRRRLVVADDGAWIDPASWSALACALDASCPPSSRERATAAIQQAAAPGIGMLAVFLPGAVEIRIDSPGRESRPPLLVRGGKRLAAGARAAVAQGTRVVLTRRSGPLEMEKKLLAELCAGAEAEIFLNGRLIARKPRLRRTLVKRRLDLAAGRAEVAVPAAGDVCRIWLLDQGIPWQLFTSSACRGLVFDAALETRRPVGSGELAALAAAAADLYHWLAERHASFPPRFQDRIEELVFNRIKATGDERDFASFAPFRRCGPLPPIALAEVRRRAGRGRLLALPPDGPAMRLPIGQEALCLTARQRDFLVNQAGVPLDAPAASFQARDFGERLSAALAGLAGHAVAVFLRPRPLAEAEWSAAETRLCRELKRAAPEGVQLAMTAGRWLGPAAWLPGTGTGGGRLLLRRRHPLVRAAAAAVSGDAAMAEVAFTALAPLPLLTAGGRWTKMAP